MKISARFVLAVLFVCLSTVVEAGTVAVNVYSSYGYGLNQPRVRASAVVNGKIDPSGKIFTCEDVSRDWRDACTERGQLNIELPEGEYSIEASAWSHQKSYAARVTLDAGGFQELWFELQPTRLEVTDQWIYNWYGTVYGCFKVVNKNPEDLRIGIVTSITGSGANALEASISQPAKSYGTIRANEERWVCRTTRLPYGVYNLPEGTHFKVKAAATDPYDELNVHGEAAVDVPAHYWFYWYSYPVPMGGKG